MKVIGKPWKCLPWQVTAIENESGKILIQIKCYYRNAIGGFNFNKAHTIYCLPEDWKKLKSEIKNQK